MPRRLFLSQLLNRTFFLENRTRVFAEREAASVGQPAVFRSCSGVPPMTTRYTAKTDWGFRDYDRDVVDRVWATAIPVPGNDEALWRKDALGAWIYRLDYGRRSSCYGWEILDLSLTRGGRIDALRPLQWQNYLDYLAAETQARVTAEGLHNVRKLL